jgi:uncharacterized protein YggT (Ycf19 family)
VGYYLCILIRAFTFLFLLRIVLSFFPLSEGSLGESVRNLAWTATEPLVLPLRRALPPLPGLMAGFAIAELLVLILLQVADRLVC